VANPPRRIPQRRPERRLTWSARWADYFDKSDADPLGSRRVFTQVAHDSFGTKDVQNAITATYVWTTDQTGHVMYGLLPTLLLGWLWSLGCDYFAIREAWRIVGCVAIALGIFAMWRSKERQDIRDTRKLAGKRFHFDTADIEWNVVTAMVYFTIGIALGLAPLIHPWLLLAAIVLAIWPAWRVAHWWLRRKLAFQQAGLPYLYRLANFTGGIRPEDVPIVESMANLANRRVSLWKVITEPDPVIDIRPAHCRHLVISGPLRSGKTSLAVGIGTEFAFRLGIGRYVTASQLMQLEVGPRDPHRTSDEHMEYDDGRVLWPLAACDLLIVDDVDGGLPNGDPPELPAIQPAQFEKAMTTRDAPLAALGEKRTVWVLGSSADTDDWRAVIARLMKVLPEEIGVIKLEPADAR
jgi:hypothetical protein